MMAYGDSGSDDLGAHFRPRNVKTVFVGESSPAEGAHFYRANSNLYRATQAAFASALGKDRVPSGEAFLRFFATRGCWLVDLADRPVRQMSAKERRAVVGAGIAPLAEMLRETRPKRIIVIKRDIATAVDQAIELAGVQTRHVLVLRYPVRQWRAEFVRDLAAFISEQKM